MKSAQQIGDFTILKTLGSGGMGSVYLAQHPHRPTPVALKVMLPAGSAGEHRRDLVEREIRAMAGLRHANIIEILDFGDLSDGSQWIAMEPCDGGDLSAHPPRNWKDLRDALSAILRGLAHAHARGLLHRDLKPSNVLFADEHRRATEVTIVDFGLTFDLREEQDLEQKVIGTPTYMAPEQCLGRWREFGPWTDIFAVGCLAWRLCTGRAPFQPEAPGVAGQLKAQVRAIPCDFNPLFPVPDGFEGWLNALLARSPAQRLHHAAEAVRRLALLGDVDPGEAGEQAIEVTPSLVIDGVVLPERSSPTLPEISVNESGLLGVNLMPLRYRKLAGRSSERRKLNNGFAEARAGRTIRIGITGDSGLGKSRLCEWLSQQVLRTGAGRVIWVRNGRDGGFGQGLNGALEALFLTNGLSGDALEKQIIRRLHLLGVVKENLPSSLAALMTDDQASPTEAAQIWREMLTELAQQSPLVLFIDDSDTTSEMPIIQAILRRPVPGLLIVLTARTAPDWWPTLERLDLKPLDRSSSTFLIRDMAPLDAELAATVARRCDGHPAFMHELLAFWSSSGALRAGAGGWELATTGEAVPSSIDILWRERINIALREFNLDWRPFLATTALAGRTVDDTVITSLAQCFSISKTNRLKAALADAGLIRITEHGIRFRYGLLHESLRGQLNPNEKITAHRRIATALAPSELQRHRAARLDHLLDGGMDEEAANLFPTVYGNSWQRRRLNDRQQMLRRWRELLERINPDHGDPRWLGYITSTIASATMKQDEGIRLGNRWLAAFKDTAGSHSGRINLMIAIANCMAERGDGSTAIKLMKACVASTNETTDRALWAKARQQLSGMVDFGLDPNEAHVHLKAAAQVHKSLGAQRQLASCLLTQASILVRLDDIDGALAAFDRSIAINTRLGNRLSVMIAHNNMGSMYINEGNLEAAAENLRLAETQATMTHSPHTTIIKINRAEVLRKLGRFDEAASVHDEATDKLIETPNPLTEYYLLGSRTACAAALGDMDTGASLCDGAETVVAALSIVSAGPDRPWRDAASEWSRIGQTRLSNRCQALADALNPALEE